MGMFDKVEGVTRQFDSNWLRAGRYFIRLEEVASGKGRKSEHWRFSAMVVGVLDDNEGKGHKVGEVVKRLRPETQDGALPEWKALVCTAYECDDDEVTKEACAEITSGKQPLAGAVLEVSARQVETKASTPGAPKWFTLVDYVRRVPDTEIEATIGAANFAKFFAKKA